MTQPTTQQEPWKTEDDLKDELERLFPKGRSKERGAALVLLAAAKIVLQSEREAERKRITEAAERLLKVKNPAHYELVDWAKGYNAALDAVLLIINGSKE